jgi:hypothetical protein
VVADHFAPANRVNVGGGAVHPLIVCVIPAVEMDTKQATHNTSDCADTDEPGRGSVKEELRVRKMLQTLAPSNQRFQVSDQRENHG